MTWHHRQIGSAPSNDHDVCLASAASLPHCGRVAAVVQ